MKAPKLILVGAGPGDPELITLRAVRALQDADAVLYDALVNPELLSFVRAEVPIVFAGKRNNSHSTTQDEINDMIVDMAVRYGTVVRLKGGDPFVFGRGFEEMELARAHGIEVEYIPGVSSFSSLPGLAGIPLTHRGVARCFSVITATTADGQLSAEIIQAAQSSTHGTIVVLMGLHKLDEIAGIFCEAGKASLGVAVIQNGSLPEQKIALGYITTINDAVRQHDIGTPAIIIIGETVKLHPQFDSVNHSLTHPSENILMTL